MAGSRRSGAVEILRVTVTVLVIAAVLLIVFSNLPPQNMQDDQLGRAVAALAIDVVIFAVLVISVILWQQRRIRRTHRAIGALIEAMALIFILFIGVLARLYHVMSISFPDSFNRSLDFFDAMYFSMTVFSTVGFGDIYPQSHLAQGLVIFQMVMDIVLLGVVVRVLVESAQERARSVKAAQQAPEPPQG